MSQGKAGREPSDKELDKMIDESIKRQEEGDGKAGEKGTRTGKGKGEKKTGKPGKRVEMPRKTGFDPWSVLMYPQMAEKSMNMVELENKLVFVVKMKSGKGDIKKAVEEGFGVKVIGVNTEITRKGHKKAYVKLHPDSPAIDIASRLGML